MSGARILRCQNPAMMGVFMRTQTYSGLRCSPCLRCMTAARLDSLGWFMRKHRVSVDQWMWSIHLPARLVQETGPPLKQGLQKAATDPIVAVRRGRWRGMEPRIEPTDDMAESGQTVRQQAARNPVSAPKTVFMRYAVSAPNNYPGGSKPPECLWRLTWRR